MNGFYGAYISACSAVGAGFRVNLIDITFGNSFNGAFVDTGSTSSAIFIDNVCHVY